MTVYSNLSFVLHADYSLFFHSLSGVYLEPVCVSRMLLSYLQNQTPGRDKHGAESPRLSGHQKRGDQQVACTSTGSTGRLCDLRISSDQLFWTNPTSKHVSTHCLQNPRCNPIPAFRPFTSKRATGVSCYFLTYQQPRSLFSHLGASPGAHERQSTHFVQRFPLMLFD